MVSKVSFLTSIPCSASTVISYLALWAVLANFSSAIRGFNLLTTSSSGSWVTCPQPT
ncbi:hypothetical protein ES703_116966 [subsurface metagenome]